MRIFKKLRLGRLAHERRGSMLVEFALVLPGFFLVLLGGLAVSDALAAYHRVQNVSGTVSVMISRLKAVSNEDIIGISSAARGYMFPFPTEDLSILVVALWIDDTGAPSIQWCERWNGKSGAGGTCSGTAVVGNSGMGYWETGSNITIADLKLPSGILTPSTGLVLARASYDWDAPYGQLSPDILGDLTMSDTFFNSPRADVTLTPPTRDRASTKPGSTFTVKQ